MNNFEVAIKGVKLASRILNIPDPRVSFISKSQLLNQEITSFFLLEEYEIIFNKDWLLKSKMIEIIISCFHEARHAYQAYSVKNHTNEDQETLIKWEKEFDSYNKPSIKNIDNNDAKYLEQEIEIDAIIFTHNKIKELFGVSTVIPSSILKRKTL